MRTTYLSLVFLCSLWVPLASDARAEFSPRDFFKKAPASVFYTEDEMTESDKQAVIKSDFKIQSSFSCDAWGVAEESPRSLTLQYCRDSSVLVYTFPKNNGDVVVAVQSARGGGRSVDLAFYSMAVGSPAVVRIPNDARESLGLTPVTDNDFLKNDAFKPEEVEVAPLTLESDGILRASAQTWMNPKWKDKTEAFQVAFIWNGSRFEKKISPVESPSVAPEVYPEVVGSESQRQ